MMRTKWMLLAALIGCAVDDVDTDPLDTGDTDAPDTDEPDTDEPDGFALAGEYVDTWGTQHLITEALWTQTFPNGDEERYHVAAYDDDARWVIAQNDADNAWNGDLFSRFDWHLDEDELWYCQSLFDGASEDEARGATPADPDDLDSGCGGFSWTALTPS